MDQVPLHEQPLHKQLEQLHAQLETTAVVDEHDREILGQLMDDIQELLSRSGEEAALQDASLGERFSAAVVHFQATHPRLSQGIAQALDALNNAGI